MWWWTGHFSEYLWNVCCLDHPTTAPLYYCRALAVTTDDAFLVARVPTIYLWANRRVVQSPMVFARDRCCRWVLDPMGCASNCPTATLWFPLATHVFLQYGRRLLLWGVQILRHLICCCCPFSRIGRAVCAAATFRRLWDREVRG